MMKIVRGAAPVVLLLYLRLRHFFISSKESFSVSQNHGPIFQNFTIAKPSYLVVAFTFNLIVLLLLLGNFNPSSYSQLSSFSASELSSFFHLDSYLHLPPIIHEGESILKDADDHDNNNNNEFVPRLVYVEYKVVDDEDEDGLMDDFYYEDSDDGSEEDNSLDDLNKRIEDFIVVNNEKWKEEP